MRFPPHASAHLHAVRFTDCYLMRHYIPRGCQACAPDVLTVRRPSCITLCQAPSGPMPSPRRGSDNHGHTTG